MIYWAVDSVFKDSSIKFQYYQFSTNSRSFQGKSHFQGVFKDRRVFPGVFQACANHVSYVGPGTRFAITSSYFGLGKRRRGNNMFQSNKIKYVSSELFNKDHVTSVLV